MPGLSASRMGRYAAQAWALRRGFWASLSGGSVASSSLPQPHFAGSSSRTNSHVSHLVAATASQQVNAERVRLGNLYRAARSQAILTFIYR